MADLSSVTAPLIIRHADGEPGFLILAKGGDVTTVRGDPGVQIRVWGC